MKYEITGGNMPVVICRFDVGDSVVTQAGGMSWHTEGVMVNTEGRGGLGKMFGRALAGESMFQNVYTATRNDQEIAFASNFPGSILPVELTGQNSLIVQKQCFLVSDLKVNTSIFFQKKIRCRVLWRRRFYYVKSERGRHGFPRNRWKRS